MNDIVGKKRERKTHVWERDPDDWYVEPEWVWEKFFQMERFEGDILDPSCGMGNCVRQARAAGYVVKAEDLRRRYPIVEAERDFLERTERVDNICSNPPFKLCNAVPFAWIEHALGLVRSKLAVVAQASWMFGEERSFYLQRRPLYRVYHITPKPSMPPGKVIEAGIKPNSGEIDYVIAVFLKGYEGEPTTRWIQRNGIEKYLQRPLFAQLLGGSR